MWLQDKYEIYKTNPFVISIAYFNEKIYQFFVFVLHSKAYIALNNIIICGDCCLCYNFHV
jgi:hypothetical protein